MNGEVHRDLSGSVAQQDGRWYGATPAGWRTPPVGANFDVQLGKMLHPDAKTGGDMSPYLRNVNVQWDRLDLTDLGEMHFDASDRIKYALRPGDLLVCEGGEVGRAAVWSGELSGCFYQKALHRVRPHRSDSTRFLMYALRAASSMGVFENEGNTSTIVHLTSEKLRAHRFPWPSPRVQIAICAFLDEATSSIDNLVAARQEMVELVDQRLDAAISQVLDRPMRNNVPLKWITRVTVGIVVRPSELYSDRGVPCLRGFNVQPGLVNDTNMALIGPEANAANAKSMLGAGDVVVVRTGNAGAAAVVPKWAVGGNCVDLLLVKRSMAIDPRFLEAVLNSAVVRRQIESQSVGALQAHFNTESLSALRVPLPTGREQSAALVEIDTLRARAASMRSALVKQIDLLVERRQALITAAVTGQIDIPGFAA